MVIPSSSTNSSELPTVLDVPKGMLHRHSSLVTTVTAAATTTTTTTTSAHSSLSLSSSSSSSSTTVTNSAPSASSSSSGFRNKPRNATNNAVVHCYRAMMMMTTMRPSNLAFPQQILSWFQLRNPPSQQAHSTIFSPLHHHPPTPIRSSSTRTWPTSSFFFFFSSSSSSRTIYVLLPVGLGVILMCISMVQLLYVPTWSSINMTSMTMRTDYTPLVPNHLVGNNVAQRIVVVERSSTMETKLPVEVDTVLPVPMRDAVTSHQDIPTIQKSSSSSPPPPRVVHIQLSRRHRQLPPPPPPPLPSLSSSIRIPKPLPLYLVLENKKGRTGGNDELPVAVIPTTGTTVDKNTNDTTASTSSSSALSTFLDPLSRIKAIAMQQYMTECVPMVSWQTQSYPTCNTFHEMDMIGGTATTTNTTTTSSSDTSTFNDDVSLLSDQGSWRSVWKVHRYLWGNPKFNNPTSTVTTPNDHDTNRTITDEETIVLKLLKFQRRDFDEESYHHHRIDAMAMERLTRSTHIVNIYGFCGQSVMTEYASSTARSRTKDKSLSSFDRLKLGRDIVQAMTHLHSIDYDNATNITMTHNDLNMANAFAIHDQIKLNDFNIGIVQRWNTSSQQICRTPVLFEAPLWKSPEEIMASATMKEYAMQYNTTLLQWRNISSTTTTTTIEEDPSRNNLSIDTTSFWVDAGPTDVFGLGNLLFQVLTKRQPWTHLELDGPKSPYDAAQRKVRGEQPYMPPKYHANTTTKIAYAALHYAVQLCYQTQPQHRPTSYELLVKLNTVIDWMEDPIRSKRIQPTELEELFRTSSAID